MSRLKERAKKNCLNCDTYVHGRYCQNCGQENIETKESVWHLVAHFFKDITHFDGKFFSTLNYLIIKPGFVSWEYLIGRRASYVNPVRMYIFTSAFFFLIFFSFFLNVDKNTIVKTVNKKTVAQIEAMDSLAFDAFTKQLNVDDGKIAKPMTRAEFKNYFDTSVVREDIQFTNTEYTSKEAYDSALNSGKAKDGWFSRQLIYKQIEINKKYSKDVGQGFADYSNILLHSLPQMFFILLPLFAFVLKLLYIRRKKYYYVDHAIFGIHFYIFSFINMLLLFSLNKLNDILKWKVIDYLVLILGLALFFYLYKAMRRFYQQRRAKTVFKFFILCFSLFITALFLFIIFIFFSLYKL